MSTQALRTPPRFVPTLTDVVDTDALAAARPEDLASSGGLSTADEPTLTPGGNEIGNVREKPATAGRTLRNAVLDDAAEVLVQQVHQRVMHRLDELLQDRLQHMLADVVREHTQPMVAALRQSLEQYVSDAVKDALAQELAAAQQSAALPEQIKKSMSL